MAALKFYLVWGTNGAGEKIERRYFVSTDREAQQRFRKETGIDPQGAYLD